MKRNSLATFLKISSSLFAIVGGVLLALNISTSGYGFIFLALSSSQMLISAWVGRDMWLAVYAGALFFFVDLFGIYRWLL